MVFSIINLNINVSQNEIVSIGWNENEVEIIEKWKTWEVPT